MRRSCSWEERTRLRLQIQRHRDTAGRIVPDMATKAGDTATEYDMPSSSLLHGQRAIALLSPSEGLVCRRLWHV